MYRSLERIHDQAERAEPVEAARAAFWLGFRLLGAGEVSRGSGWLARAERLLDQAGGDCVERGYLLLPEVRRKFQAREYASAYDAAVLAESIGERHADQDLRVFARNLRGRVLLRQGELERGLKLQRCERVSATLGGLPQLETGSTLDVANVIWCTGYHPGFSWIDLPIFDQRGQPQHMAGVVPAAPGLYFVGLHFLYAMSSTMIHGVGRDAARIATAVASRTHVSSSFPAA
jgi:hypothetical protein